MSVMYGSGFQKLRQELIIDKKIECICGLPSEELHHNSLKYPVLHETLTRDDVTPLCKECHTLITTKRRSYKYRQHFYYTVGESNKEFGKSIVNHMQLPLLNIENESEKSFVSKETPRHQQPLLSDDSERKEDVRTESITHCYLPLIKG